MLKTVRKTFVIILVVVMSMINTLPFIASAALSGKNDNFVWTLDPETQTLKIEGSGYVNLYWKNLNFITLEITGSNLQIAGFYDCETVKNIIIGDGSGTTVIRERAFANCINLEKVDFRNAVDIDTSAFTGCSSLSNVIFNPNVGNSSIGISAFRNCQALTDIYLPDNITNIGASAFSGTRLLSKDKDSYGVAYINNHLIRALDSDLASYEIREGTVSIASCAFESVYDLSSVIIPSSVVTICYGAFYTGNKAGLGLNLKNVVFKENSKLKRIDDEAFYKQPIESINFPKSLEYIGERAFEDCDELSELFIPMNVNFIGQDAFNSCDNLKKIEVDKDNLFYSSDINSVLYNKNKISLILWPYGQKGIYTFNIPDGVEKITSNAVFVDGMGESDTVKISFPKSLKTLEEDSFSYFNIKNKIIYYEGSEEQWNLVEKERPFSGTNYTIYFNHICSYSLVETKQASCFEDGVITYTCSCGSSYTEAIPATGHTPSSRYETIKIPTCTEVGTDVNKCVTCKEVLDTKEILATGHTAGSWVTTKEPTCTAEGTKVKKCTKCGAEVETQAIATTEHIAGNWQIITMPTATDEGVKIKKCTDCGKEMFRETIPMGEMDVKIPSPSKNTVKFGDTLVLTLGETELPEGMTVAWFVEGAGVATSVSEDGLECRVTSIANGSATIYAKLVDEEENIITNADGEEIFDEITLNSKAGFWQRFISFFKNLFGINRVIY